MIEQLDRLSPEERRRLALRLRQTRRSEPAAVPAQGEIPRLAAAGPHPLSYPQRRLWFLGQLEPEASAYNVAAAVRLRGDLDPAALAGALTEVVRRHESLRTVFATDAEGEPVQVVRPSTETTALHGLPLADLSGLGAAAEAEVRREVSAIAGRPFDLARGPLLRTVLLRLAAEDHCIVVAMHHIVSDGWSMSILVRELVALYGAARGGRPSPLPELPLQYTDFTRWQRRRLAGAALAEDLDYWRGRLAGLPARLDLPADHPRPPVQTFRGASRAEILPPPLAAALRDLARRQGVTPFMLLLAGFQTLLARWSGAEDLAVGVPVSGRERPETQGLIGFFVNSLVLRADLTGRPTFLEVLERTRRAALGAQAHQDLPFEVLVEELRPERDLGHSPLFQVMFAFQNTPREELAAPGLSGIEALPIDWHAAQLDLTLSIEDGLGGGLATGWEYATDLFDATTILRLAGYFHTLLAGVAADPRRPLPELPLLSPAERAQLVDEWNDTRLATSSDIDVAAAVAARARQAPDVIAIDGRWGALSYGELVHRASRLAGRLAALGVGPEVRVGVCLERSPEALVALLAVLQAGGAFVPLDPAYPRERLAFLLEDSGARVVVTTGGAAAVLGPHQVAIPPVAPDDPDPWPGGPPPLPEQAAYVLYTSGSTGLPKGAVISHRSFSSFATAVAHSLSLGPGDRFLQFAPLSFDVILEEVFPAWLAGASVVLEERDRLVSMSGLPRTLARWGVTVLELPTAFWLEWDGHLRQTGERPPACLRLLLVGGERVPAEPAARWLGWLEVMNAFGLTETAVTTTLHPVRLGGRERNDVPIGRPLPEARLHVLDGELGPVPIGVAGELFVGGVGVGRGYTGRPDLTAERFVPDPFASEPGARLYRTGDSGRHLADGLVEILGRLDHQVKIRGHRIETGEVEAALTAHPGVRQAVVVAGADLQAGPGLVAYVAGGAEPGELREWLGRRLPAVMVPAFIVVLPELPLTPNGKVDRRALPMPEQSARAQEAPRGPVEDTLAAIWAEVLRRDRICRDDDFFELGGHSLLATRVISRVRGALGVELSLRSLFEAPTPRLLAERVAAELRRGTAPRLPPPAPVPGRGPVAPLSFAQERLWFLEQLEPGRTDYNVPVAMRLTGALDVPALAAALEEVVRRHEVLRVTFRGEAGVPAQITSPAGRLLLPLADLSGLSGAESEARRLASVTAGLPFDLARGPVFRLLLLRLAPDDHVVALTFHHIAGDGWSTGILVREVAALYTAALQGHPSPLPELPLQYPDFALWQRAALTGPALDEPLAWWRRRLAGLPPGLDLPHDHPRGPGRGHGRSEPVHIPAPLADRLAALGRRDGATLFMVVLAAFQALLGRWARQDDFAVGTPVAHRDHLETEGLIGLFVNTLVLRADLAGDPEFRELLARVRETALGAFVRQEVPFERLVEELQPERELGLTPLFQVMFRLEQDDAPGEAVELPGLTLRPMAPDHPAVRVDLTLALFDTGEGLTGSLDYDGALFEATTVRRLTEHLRILLEGIAAEPGQRLSLLPWLTAAERHVLTREWNDGTAPAGGCVHELFEEQAARTPDAVAVVCEDEALTFRELDERADRLGLRLRALGVVPEVAVGLCTERSLEMVVGLLGILKSGGAYLPLDPAFPEARLRFQLREAGTRVLVVMDSLLRALPGLAAEAVCVSPLAPGTSEPCRGGARPENLAYVIYTSGSTGQPKGVPIEHRQLAGYLRGVVERLDLPAGATYATVSTPAADLGHTVLFPPLVFGGSLHVISRDRAGDAEAMAEYFASRAVDCLKIVPSHLAALQGSRPGSVLPRRRLVLGGEAADGAAVRRLAAASDGCQVFNHYGPTETTVGVATYAVAGHPWVEPRGGSLPLGRPLPGATLHLLSPWLEPVPIGATGELSIGGPNVARGYLGRPAATAERFVPDPSGREPGARLYRTGDLARLLPGGEVEFLGRTDDQTKIRGFRVEPGEVESALRTHPGVRDAVVLPREIGGERRLVAWLAPTAETGHDLSPAALRPFLARLLPEPMLPAAIVRIAAIPLTPNGKIDRAALAAVAPEEGEGAGRTYAPPRDEVEEKVAALWSELLGVERPGLHDSFFDLGGHSLLVTRLRSRLLDAFGADVPLRDLFTQPTLAATADAVRSRQGDASAARPRLSALSRDRHRMRRGDLDSRGRAK